MKGNMRGTTQLNTVTWRIYFNGRREGKEYSIRFNDRTLFDSVGFTRVHRRNVISNENLKTWTGQYEKTLCSGPWAGGGGGKVSSVMYTTVTGEVRACKANAVARRAGDGQPSS